MDNPEIGIAMIARNAANIIPFALDPFMEHVDAIAIVLGGTSSDNTAEVAEKYATLPIEPYNGELDDDGRLLHFGDARNQSFDILRRAGLRYALVVDTDDRWTGAENVRTVLDQMVAGNFAMAVFKYSFEGGDFMQPRIYDMTLGHWESPCHNFWSFDTEQPPVALQTALMSLEQKRESAGHGEERRQQNIRISQHWMKKNGDNCRLLLHMAKDAMVDRDLDTAEDALERYFVQVEQDAKPDVEELYNAHHAYASVLILRNAFDDALRHALLALTVRPHGQSWTLAAEAAGWMAKGSPEDRPLLKLSAFCAQQALDTGKARGNLHWQAERLSGSLPLFLKARALAGLGEYRKARGALDLGLKITPNDAAAQQLLGDICRKLGDLE